MATQEETGRASREDRFFGIETVIETPPKPDKAKEELEVEVEEEEAQASSDKSGKEKTDEGSKKDLKAQTKPDDDDDDSDDMSEYGERVQRRIKKLTRRYHDEERARQDAEKMRDEAVRAAQAAYQRFQQSQQVIESGEAELVKRINEAAQVAVDAAKKDYAHAYESGDKDAVLAAQEELINSKAKLIQAEAYAADYQQRQGQRQQQNWQPGEPYPGQTPQYPMPQMPRQPRVPQPTAEAKKWAEKNPWFNDRKHRDMTAVAFAMHETMVRDEDYLPDTDEYYRELDKRIQARFPEYFEEKGRTAQTPPRNTSPVVAPADRTGGGPRRKVKLTSSQLRLATKLGITPEQYANQLLKDSSND